MTELECIFSVEFSVQGGCCQDRARASWIPTQDPIRLHRQHRTIQGHFSSWDTSKRCPTQDVLVQMFPETAQSVVLSCSHICRSEKLEGETSSLGYWWTLKVLGRAQIMALGKSISKDPATEICHLIRERLSIANVQELCKLHCHCFSIPQCKGFTFSSSL